MNIKPIRTEEDYDAALARVDEIFFAERSTPEFDELDILVTLIEAYEAIHYPMGEVNVCHPRKFQRNLSGISLG